MRKKAISEQLRMKCESQETSLIADKDAVKSRMNKK